MEQQAYRFKNLQAYLGTAKPGLKIFILEGSRHIPAAVPWKAEEGLLEPAIEEYPDTFVASSVSFGYTSSASGQSTFTKFFAQHMGDAGLTLEQVFDATRRDVYEATNHMQNPSAKSSLVKVQFRFLDAPRSWPRPLVPVANRIDREEYVWIPAGKFMMGCVPRRHFMRAAGESPTSGNHHQRLLDG